MVPYTQTTRFIANQLCRDQYDTVDYVAERGVGHSQTLDQSTALINRWLQSRFAGSSTVDSCTRPGLGIAKSP